jgi:hypothetical protein
MEVYEWAADHAEASENEKAPAIGGGPESV